MGKLGIKKLFIIILSVSLGFLSWGQATSIQKMEGDLRWKAGKEKIDLLEDLSLAYKKVDPSIGLAYAEEALKLSKKIGDSDRELSVNILIAEHLFLNGRKNKAIRTANSCLATCRSRGDILSEMRVLSLLVSIYSVDERDQKKLADAEKAYQKARSVRDLSIRNRQLRSSEANRRALAEENLEIGEALDKSIEDLLRLQVDSAILAEQKARLAQETAELKFETERLEKEALEEKVVRIESERALEASKNRNRTLLLIITLLAALVSIALLLVLYQRQKRKRLEERSMLQKQLQIKDKMASLGQVTAGIAHEIKNPLNFVNNFAEGSTFLLQDLEETVDEVKPQIAAVDYEEMAELTSELKLNAKDILQHGKRADQIVNSMLNHARGDAGSPQSTDLNQLLEESLNLATLAFKGNHPDFNFKIEKKLIDTLPNVAVIPQEVGRVLLNIFNNACDALYEKQLQLGGAFEAVLDVQSSFDKKYATLTIKDNGPGIPAKVKEKVFNPFFTTKATGNGNTGLGLSMSYDIIVQGHEGELTMESEEGQYTLFKVQLPIGK